MFSNVGVNPFPGNGGTTVATAAPPPRTRAELGVGPGHAAQGTGAASHTRGETGHAVDPSDQKARSERPADEHRARNGRPHPPDPNAPAGPPPAFEQTVLEKARATALSHQPRTDVAETASAPGLGAAAAAHDPQNHTSGHDVQTRATGHDDQVRATGHDDQVRATGHEADGEETGPVEVPPSAAERASSEFSTLRRIEAPYDPSTVDVTR